MTRGEEGRMAIRIREAALLLVLVATAATGSSQTGAGVGKPGLLISAPDQAGDPGGSWQPRRPGRRETVPDREVAPGIYEIDGLATHLPYDDLRPFGRLIGDAEVVALGESVHTSGGYYKAKHRLFRYLVEEKGFRAFAFESPWADAERVRQYVETCNGYPNAVVSNGLFGVWASEEVVGIVKWMCWYNQRHPDDPVAFWGFDIQQPWDDGPMLLDYIAQAAPAVSHLSSGIERCNGVGYSLIGYYTDPDAQRVDEDDHQACLSALDELETYFDGHEDELIAESSADALAWARINLAGLRAWQGQRYYAEIGNNELEGQSRDEGMAHVFQAIKALRNADDRVVIWAHNWHIAYSADTLADDAVRARTMGSFLKEALGDSYFALGLVAYEVYINWPGFLVGREPLVEDDSHVEYRLHHQIGRDYLLIDLSFPGTDEPFLEDGTLYHVNGWRMIPAQQFGGLFYLDRSPMMHALGW
jgi:erythromycin esterase